MDQCIFVAHLGGLDYVYGWMIVWCFTSYQQYFSHIMAILLHLLWNKTMTLDASSDMEYVCSVRLLRSSVWNISLHGLHVRFNELIRYMDSSTITCILHWLSCFPGNSIVSVCHQFQIQEMIHSLCYPFSDWLDLRIMNILAWYYVKLLKYFSNF